LTSYLFKRIILIIPGLFLISLITFFVLDSMISNVVEKEISELDWSKIKLRENNVQDWKKGLLRKYHFDQPLFYFSITTFADPDSLFIIYPPEKKVFIKNIYRSYSNRELAGTFIHSLEKEILRLPDLSGIYRSKNEEEVERQLTRIPSIHTKSVITKFEMLKKSGPNYYKLLPKIKWNGTNNRYHFWLRGILKGDLGRSISDGLPIKYRLFPAMINSLVLGSISIFLLFLLSVPLGIFLSYHPAKFAWISQILYAVNAMPLFWIGELLIFLLASKSILYIFPSFGIGEAENIRIDHLVLPVTSLMISALPVVAIQTKAAFETEMGRPYILMARVKGLNQKKILLKHIFRNALNPLITLFTSYLPALVGGVMIVEYVYSIPGMGRLLVDAISKHDFPLILTIIVLIGLVKIISNIIADISYRLADPRISFK